MDAHLRDIVATYRESPSEELEEDYYNALSKFVTIQVKKSKKIDTDLISLEDVCHLITTDLFMKVLRGGEDIYAYGAYVKLYIKGYEPWKLVPKAYNEVEITEAMNLPNPENSNQVLEWKYVKDMIAEYYNNTKGKMPFSNPQVVNLIYFLAVQAVFSKVDVKRISNKRVGFLASLLNVEFIEFLKKESLING